MRTFSPWLRQSLRAVLLPLLFLPDARAVNEKGDWPWNLKLHGWHDREVAEELGTGWFMNVGPTGIRAQITHENPEAFTVRYVFKKSPAAGLVRIGDLIVGANGRRMTVKHQFGRRRVTGWDGPMTEMAKHVEDSQGRDGKLELIVWPGGQRSAEKTVAIQIEPLGRFSATWPFDCPRSDRQLTELCDVLVEEYDRAGKFEKMTHTHSSCVLALMAANERKYDSLVKKIMRGYGSNRYDPNGAAGFPAWGQVHDGIVMGEYHLLTGDRSLEPAMESLARCLDNSVWPTTGGLSHKPFAAIQRRMAAGGPKGYGAMAMPAGLGMVALSLFKEAGLPHAEASYQRIHEGFLCSVSPNGSIGYGFKDWDHAVIELADPKASPKSSPEGIGYECKEGLRGAGDYRIVWPTKADPRYRPTDWLRNEVETNRVFDKGGTQRLVVRNMAPDEPTRAYRHDGNSCDHFGRSGTGALAHAIGNAGNESWKHLSDLMAAGCAKSGRRLLDGHASTHMHVLWGSLGAALADEKEFRAYLDEIKWWMIMAQAHDGGYVVMPGRDYASTDHVYGTRNYPSACAALILALKEKRLRITGATSAGDGGASSGGSRSTSREARPLSAKGRALLPKALLQALGELSREGAVKDRTIQLSKARAEIHLDRVEPSGRLVFKSLSGGHEASFGLDELALADLVNLAAMAAAARPGDGEVQALAGILHETSGNTAAADRYYAQAGEEIIETLSGIFE